jgi:hypothetical protein
VSALTPEEERAVACARIGASHEVDTLLAIIDRLAAGEDLDPVEVLARWARVYPFCAALLRAAADMIQERR